ncbi:MAG: FG-GAP repeat protein [Deltaproteobacteria bacterium]|nr:FG-GAP repeat protein [Deltaproteobacteria bacterium]
MGRIVHGGATGACLLSLVLACDSASLGRVDSGEAADARGDDAVAAADAGDEPRDAGTALDQGVDADPIDAGEDAPADAARADTGPPAPSDPGVPVLRAPRNGWASGSVHALAADVADDPLRPRLRWESVDGATHYLVQLSSACEVATYRGCDFAGVTVERVAAPTTEHVPATRLDVERRAPVGRRYYWRVQACDADACSAFSEPRYLDVGRLRDDFDGDGYSDAVVGTPDRVVGGMAGFGVAWVLAGSPSGVIAEPVVELMSPTPDVAASFARVVVAIGDVQADGFADLAVSEPHTPAMVAGVEVRVGRVHVYHGSAAGIRADPHLTLDFPESPATAWFGSGLAGGQDHDADGYSDLVVGAEYRGTGRVYLYRGGAGGIDPTLAARVIPPSEVSNFGIGLAALGDVDGDGRSDVGIGAFSTSTPSAHAGWAGLYLGADDVLERRVAAAVVPDAEDSWIELGYVIAGAFDANADGFADVAVAAPYMDAVGVNEGAVLVFAGGRDTIGAVPDAVLTSPEHGDDAYFGAHVTTGDFDGDGFDDLVAGVPLASAPSHRSGRAWLIRGGPDPTALGEPVAIDSPTGTAGAQLSVVASGDFDGNGLADLLVGAPFEDVGGVAAVGALYVVPGSGDGLASVPIGLPSPRSEASLHFGYAVD